MSIFLFANNAVTTVASSINSAAVTVSVAPGDGALFPSPGAGQLFCLTFVDAATGLINEIVHCTSRTGDVLTIVRAQEGTTARNWNAGDTAANLWTMGSANAMLQQGQDQQQSGNYATDTGTVNAMAVTLSPAPTSMTQLLGAPIRVLVANTNTNTTPTLNVNGLGAQNCVTVGVGGVAGLSVGGTAAGKICEFLWDGTNFQYLGRVATASLAMIQAGTDFISPITSLGLASALVATTGSGYIKFPSGVILQYGNFTTTSGINDTVTYPTAFPTAIISFVAMGTVSGGNLTVCSIGGSGISTTVAHVGTGTGASTPFPAAGAGVTVRWFAAGY